MANKNKNKNKNKKDSGLKPFSSDQARLWETVAGNDPWDDARWTDFQTSWGQYFNPATKDAGNTALTRVFGKQLDDQQIRQIRSVIGRNLSPRDLAGLQQRLDRRAGDAAINNRVVAGAVDDIKGEQGEFPPIPDKSTPFAPQGPIPPEVLPRDPLLAGASSGSGALLGFDPATGRFDMANGLMAGPQQGYSRAMLQGLHGSALDRLMQNQRGAMAGQAAADTARGIAGTSPATALRGSLDANTRSQLARANLDAQMQGLDYGMKKYGAEMGTAATLAELGEGQQNRMFSKFTADKGAAYQAWQNAEQAAAQFMTNFLSQMASSGVGADKKSSAAMKDLHDQANLRWAELKDKASDMHRKYKQFQ